MNRKSVLAIVVVSCFTLSGAAEVSPYSGLESRQIKALAQDEIDAYLEGRGMSLALPAELNGYPGPKHVLELASELELTAVQIDEVREQFDLMHRDAVAIGEKIVTLERELDDRFASSAANADSLRPLLDRIGSLHAQLRFVHLKAHLDTRAMLSPKQIAKYAELRGYGSSHRGHRGHH